MADTNEQVELLAAAGRLRSLLGCTAIDFDNASPDCVADMWRLAEAWLSEHPADDQEPLTGEWVEAAIGSDNYDRDTAFLTGKTHLGAHCVIVLSLLRYGTNAGRWEANFEGFPLRTIDTRGEFVRLCRELNIPLNMETKS